MQVVRMTDPENYETSANQLRKRMPTGSCVSRSRLQPLAILAQAAFESGWGASNLAKESRNYFGLTAYGCSNAYWHGGKTTVKASSYPLNFRRYDTRENSFLDFARLIRNSYRSAWQVSNDLQAYAKEIAYSPYISELNGDNRETYRLSIIQIAQTIQAIMALIVL